MKKLILLLFIVINFFTTGCNAQISNPKTDTFKVYGNCGMCKKTIEKAGNLKKIAKVNWDTDSKVATLTYDSTKTNANVILKRIALAGYDNEKFLAPDDVYSKLHGCCQYDRPAKESIIVESPKSEPPVLKVIDTPKAIIANIPTIAVSKNTNPFKALIDNYFAVKDALVKTDGKTASIRAQDLLTSIQAVKMETLTEKENATWMKVMKDLAFDAEHIADTKDAKHQRDHFNTLSKNMYAIIKASKQDKPTYYQFCPMANDGKGANWLSRDATIKNPYYGSQMLNCGKIQETIK